MDSRPTRPLNVGWHHQVGGRVLKWWLAKMVGTILGMVLFFTGYFWLLRHPHTFVTTMPLIAVDRFVGFSPWALPLYLSLWLYVSLAPALLIEFRALLSFTLGAVELSVIGFGIFFFWPTAVPRSDVDWSAHPAFAFLKGADAAGNACPSLHVAFAVFTAIWFARLGRQIGVGRVVRILNWLWCVGILYSTMAIRQHVALDVFAGAVLGAAVAAVHLRWLRGCAI